MELQNTGWPKMAQFLTTVTPIVHTANTDKTRLFCLIKMMIKLPILACAEKPKAEFSLLPHVLSVSVV